jgi:flagellar biosynthesis/type III secretory pathway protein FliH
MYKNEKKEGKEEGRKEGNKKNKKEGRKEFSGMYFSEKICNDCSIAGKLQS